LAANPGLVQSDILPVRLRPALCETDSGLVKPIGAERRLYADDHATRRIDRSCYLIWAEMEITKVHTLEGP